MVPTPARGSSTRWPGSGFSRPDRCVHATLRCAAKCETLLHQGVSVTIVDLVTLRGFNLYGDLLDLIGQTDPLLSPEPPGIYAVACRWRRQANQPFLETWNRPLTLGEPLPTLPLWLSADLAIPLNLESSYEQTCRDLRIAS